MNKPTFESIGAKSFILRGLTGEYLVKKTPSGIFKVYDYASGNIVMDAMGYTPISNYESVTVLEYNDDFLIEKTLKEVCYSELNCNCDIRELLNVGCKCGAIQKERSKRGQKNKV